MDENCVVLTEYYAAGWQSLVDEATRMLRGDRMTAEDVVQTAYLRLLSHLSSSPSVCRHVTPSTVKALVLATMFNLMRDLWRRRQHEQDYERQLSAAPPWMRQTDDVFSVCSAHHIAELLEQRLARMDDSVARVVRMNVFEGKGVGDIAKELDMKYKTAENRLQAGRKQVRELIRKAL